MRRLLILPLSLGCLAACSRTNDPSDVVLASAAEVRSVAQTVTVVGSTEYARPVDVSTEVAGRVVRTFVSAGDLVQVGQPLALIDTEPLAAAVATARIQRDQAALQVRRLAHDSATAVENALLLSEVSRVASSGSSEVERRKAERAAQQASIAVRDARLAVELADLMLANAHRSLSRAVVRAPFSGVVVRILSPSGTVAVTGTATAALAGIARLAVSDTVWVRVRVPVQLVVGIKRGIPAVVRSLDRERAVRVTGSVIGIDDEQQLGAEAGASRAEDSAPTVSVTVALERHRMPSDWPMGVPVEVSIQTGRPVRGVAVPLAAIVSAAVAPDGREGVWAIREGKTYFVPLTSGPDDGKWAITSLPLTERLDVVVGSSSTLMLRVQGGDVHVSGRWAP